MDLTLSLGLLSTLVEALEAFALGGLASLPGALPYPVFDCGHPQGYSCAPGIYTIPDYFSNGSYPKFHGSGELQGHPEKDNCYRTGRQQDYGKKNHGEGTSRG